MVRRTVLMVGSVVKVVTKPLLTLALLKFIFSMPLNLCA